MRGSKSVYLVNNSSTEARLHTALCFLSPRCAHSPVVARFQWYLFGNWVSNVHRLLAPNSVCWFWFRKSIFSRHIQAVVEAVSPSSNLYLCICICVWGCNVSMHKYHLSVAYLHPFPIAASGPPLRTVNIDLLALRPYFEILSGTLLQGRVRFHGGLPYH